MLEYLFYINLQEKKKYNLLGDEDELFNKKLDLNLFLKKKKSKEFLFYFLIVSKKLR